MYDLAVIIPYFNEEENIVGIIPAVAEIFHESSINGQIIIVDDNSRDGTSKEVRTLQNTMAQLSLIVRTENPGLSQSIMTGFQHANSRVLLVMDADFSHPPSLIPVLYQKIQYGADVVIGSRYADGGSIEGWPLHRIVLSRGATFFARALFPSITDPVSGFFAVRREVVRHASLKPRGYKILLEILGRGKWSRAIEIPYTFHNRVTGTSKMSPRICIDYVSQVLAIGLHALRHHESHAWEEEKRMVQFTLVGISGIFVNMALLFTLTNVFGIYYLVSSVIAIELSILNNFFWNDFFTFSGGKGHEMGNRLHRLISYHLVSAGGSAINLLSLFLLTEFAGVYYLLANIIGITLSFAWNFFVNRNTTWKSTG